MSDKKSSRRPVRGTEAAEHSSAGPTSPMNVSLLEQIVKLMAANDLNTVDVRDGNQRIVLKRGVAVVAMPAGMPMATMPQALPAPAASAGTSAPAAPAQPAGGAQDESKLVPIKAEMVGTFYASAKPGEKAFVAVGSDVDTETQVCLIEAMKNYFPVKAGVRGTIAKILVQDGQTVQFDQALFLVQPA